MLPCYTLSQVTAALYRKDQADGANEADLSHSSIVRKDQAGRSSRWIRVGGLDSQQVEVAGVSNLHYLSVCGLEYLTTVGYSWIVQVINNVVAIHSQG